MVQSSTQNHNQVGMELRRRKEINSVAGCTRQSMDGYSPIIQRKVGLALCRSDNHIKNHFYSIIRKSLRKMCKFVDVKTTSLNIYSVKPYTISQIFYLGGAGEGRSER